MSGLTKLSLKNGVAVVILCALVLGYGLFSSTQIRQQTFPDLEFPAVFVQAVYPGASTEEIETVLTMPIEQSLMNLKDYDALTSTTAENSASIFIQFPFGSDMTQMTADVEGALAKLQLPASANINVQRLSIGAAPIYTAAIFSTTDNSETLEQVLTSEIIPQLSKIEGVSSATLVGTKTEELRIEVDKGLASQHGLSLSTIQKAIQSLDYAVPLGSVNQDGASIPIRLVGKIGTLEKIENLQLTAGLGGGTQQGASSASVKIKLADIAKITTISEQNEIARFNGKESFIIDIMKTQDSNTADVANEVKDVLASYQESANLDIHVVMDQGVEIEHSVSSLITEGLFGALFCVIIIFVFLRNVRATIISIISLPISIFVTISMMNQLGYTLNIMTLGGIAVSIGRIVDDSIVVIENIYRWRQEKGDELKGKELAYRATKEVIGAVSSSTVATLVVFLPLAFVSGIIGQFFRPFALAVVFSILTSLLVSVMLIPVLGAKFFNKVKPHKSNGRMISAFEKLIRGSLKRKPMVLTLAAVLLIGSLSTIPLIGVSFLPAESVPSISMELKLPAQSRIDQTDELSKQVEKYLQDVEHVINYQASLGSGGSGNPFLASGGSNTASFTVQFEESTDMNVMQEKLTADLNELVLSKEPEAVIEVKEGDQQGPPTGNNVEVTLYANDLEDLALAASQVENLLRQNNDLKNISNNLQEVTPKWVLSINQAGIEANVSYFQMMQTVNEQLRPIEVGTYLLDGQPQNITMSYLENVTSKEQLENIDIVTAAGVMKLKDIADIEEQHAPVTINHEDGKTYALISGVIKGEDTAKVTKEVKADVESLVLPSGVETSFGGGLDMIIEGFTSLGIAMVAAICLVFLVMSMTFGGLRTPLIILSSLLFVPVGSLGALLITGQSLSMSAMIGMLMLVGIVVTNAVVLLDRVEKNAKSGIPLVEAIVEASKTRLRPILMTACATILALVPLALSESSTSLISGGLAITVIGGLFSSTLLTLIVLPVIYHMTGKKRKWDVDSF
jgi:multidrug efflux pump subunit AcrB